MYRVIYKGLEVYCESPEDVSKLAESTTLNGARRARRTGSKSTPRSIKTMVKSLQENQKQLLQLLATTSPEPATDTDLRDALGLGDNKQLAGILSGIHKAAKRSGIEIGQLFTKESSRNTATGDRTYRYQLNASNLDEIQAGLSAK